MVAFSDDGADVLAADRSGDVYRVSISAFLDVNENPSSKVLATQKINEEEIPLLGHYAMITDMQVLQCRIATCDRDNKIRVSRFPNAVHIQSFCLGHSDFVSRVAWVDDSRLLSGGGDGTLRLWQVSCGTEVSSLDLSEILRTNRQHAGDCFFCVVVGIAVHPKSQNIAIVMLHGYRRLVVVDGINDNKLRFRQFLSVNAVQSGTSAVLSGALFDDDGLLWVSACESNVVCAYAFSHVEAIAKLGNPCRTVNIPAISEIEVDRVDGSFQNARDWLSGLRKKQLTDDWKGKKRKRISDI